MLQDPVNSHAPKMATIVVRDVKEKGLNVYSRVKSKWADPENENS